ncbi:STAS domain-containing protein [Sedimentibacter sp. zth1]|uniref:STAS domain-containing protein n=1 Tax=Sedimentibacter sp. zth1 TaxID=2816908 RepID=UPI001A91C113|nr:STAS domain-containing protein [Sedimentibacter sp. zth1]QSX05176.1 STAS domain-containing protein [Sedimentibacter sp. zth1]
MSLILEENKECEENYIEVLPIGEVDIYTSPKFKENVLNTINNSNKNIIINAEKLEYLDSTGLGALMSILKTTKENHIEIKIKNLKPNIYKLFDITGLNKVFNIEV